MVRRLVFIGVFLCTVSAEEQRVALAEKASCTAKKRPTAQRGLKKAACLLTDFVWQFVSIDTLWIAALTTPVYVATRLLDNDIHECFYCPTHHKNVHQLPKCCSRIAKIGVPVELVALCLLSFSRDYELAKSSQLFALTLPISWGVKKGLKHIKTEACVRPKNEFFDRKIKYYNGCPSGHMFELVYAATYYTMREGFGFSWPLWGFAGAVFGVYVNCNRHFPSQMIAGAGLGVIFATAANKVADRWVKTEDACNLFSCHGNGIRCSFKY